MRLKGARKKLIKIGGVNAKWHFKHHIWASAKNENYTNMLIWIIRHSNHRIEYWPPNRTCQPFLYPAVLECDFFFEDIKDAVNFKICWINNEEVL